MATGQLLRASICTRTTAPLMVRSAPVDDDTDLLDLAWLLSLRVSFGGSFGTFRLRHVLLVAGSAALLVQKTDCSASCSPYTVIESQVLKLMKGRMLDGTLPLDVQAFAHLAEKGTDHWYTPLSWLYLGM